ncbi:hypothetical protein ACKWTF_006695 [Chironomus riparius]
MGSEQYCLRWNNHQSNLLGVFSQLLQDESLVDVTLACSEGTSIRAHKVVLSACSSYFQSLFLDHPAKHPIVILKDVRFAELRTLIEFMYKGEVNVEYCQLSALLKTAESLKVKGLAEMTNQSTASKEPERDRDSERLRLHTPTTPSAAPSSSVKNEILELSSKQQRLDNNICSPSPPSRVPSSPGSSLSSIYQKKLLTISASASATTTSITGSSSHHIDSIIKEEPTFNDHRTHHQHRNDESMEDDDDDDENIQMKNEVGLNMTLNSSLLQNSISSSVNSTSSLADMQSSRYSSNLLGNSSNAGGTRQQSPLSSDLPGPSGIGPMQHAPLSLKKEADWDRSDDKESSSSEYRHSHGDMRDRYQRFMAPKPSSSIMSGLHRLKSSSTPQMSSTATSPSMVPSMMPFHFPFSPFSLGMNLFDMTAANENRNSPSIDPNRILHILHQQSLLAEELLKYRALLGLPSPSTSTSSTSSSSNSSSHPFFNDMKPSIELFKIPNSHDTKFNKDIVHESEMIPSKRQTPSSSTEIDLTKDDGCSTPKIKARPESELLSEKSSTTSTTISPAAVSAMLIDPDELKCHICMANFPSLWLLEQHTALQHSQLSCSEKQNKCEHCGQNYRYNCCLQSTLLMNSQDHPGNPNRARVPADKLFTCDVCGMQFRYLKSFKKHRLNHALERLHGKKEMNENSGELMVSSTNDESGIPKGVISLEDEQMLLDDQDQDDTIDSISNTNSNMNFSSTNLINTKQMNDPNLSISADNNNFGGDIKDKSSISSAITECDKQETNGNITSSDKLLDEMTDMANTQHDAESSSALNFTMSSLQNSFSMQGSSGSLKSLTMTNQSLMGLNSQEASILNFLRVDADKRDKRFACPFCGKCVRSKENLKLHVRKHTGERPFVCLFCGRAFGGKSDLTRHLRIHTGER